MSDNFFEKPFEEETLIKLELYHDYVEKWVPVFVARRKLLVNTVNIFDFFAGVGCDINGNYGSPLIALKVLMSYHKYISRNDLNVNLYLNDFNEKYCNRLKKNIDKFDFDKASINVQIINKDFQDAYKMLKSKMNNSANLLFLDQFGIRYVNPELFLELTELKMTDQIFFISSSTFNRFTEDENIRKILHLEKEELLKRPYNHIHKIVHEGYKKLIPDNKSYYLAPFSIRRGANIYGLIFGSNHPLGMEKFLEVCWDKDSQRGEANFDIEGERINPNVPKLFPEMDIPKKIGIYERELMNNILNGNLKTDREVYNFMINRGFLNRHTNPILNRLKTQEKKIQYKNISLKCKTVMDKNRPPSKIEIL